MHPHFGESLFLVQITIVLSFSQSNFYKLNFIDTMINSGPWRWSTRGMEADSFVKRVFAAGWLEIFLSLLGSKYCWEANDDDDDDEKDLMMPPPPPVYHYSCGV